MISENKKSPKTLAIVLVLALAMLFTFQMNPVLAFIPEVTNIEYYTIGTDTFVNITVYHMTMGQEGHYVNLARFDINGTYHDVALDPQPEGQYEFFVEYNLGEVAENETYIVRARVEDGFHGESSWTDTVVIPEFPTLSLPLVLAMVSIAVLLCNARARVNVREKKVKI